MNQEINDWVQKQVAQQEKEVETMMYVEGLIQLNVENSLTSVILWKKEKSIYQMKPVYVTT